MLGDTTITVDRLYLTVDKNRSYLVRGLSLCDWLGGFSHWLPAGLGRCFLSASTEQFGTLGIHLG